MDIKLELPKLLKPILADMSLNLNDSVHKKIQQLSQSNDPAPFVSCPTRVALIDCSSEPKVVAIHKRTRKGLFMEIRGTSLWLLEFDSSGLVGHWWTYNWSLTARARQNYYLLCGVPENISDVRVVGTYPDLKYMRT